MANEQDACFFESGIPFQGTRIRAAAVYCSDGRFGEQFDDLLQNALQLPRYDRLAVPGGSASLAGHFATFREAAAVFEQLRFLVEVHAIERVVLIAHENCAYYSHRLGVTPLRLEAKQREDIGKAVSKVRSLSPSLRIDSFFARKHHSGGIQFELVKL